jgi:hypothetical protein
MNKKISEPQKNLTIKIPNKITSDVCATICVMTCNQGKNILKNINYYLVKKNSPVEFLIIDNCSTNEIEEYKQFEKIAKEQTKLSYVRTNKKSDFMVNYLNALIRTNSSYVMIINDNDLPNKEKIIEAITFLKKHPNIGALKGSIEPMPNVLPKKSIIQKSEIFESGFEAITRFGIWNNYLSGTIYNKKVLKKT